MTTSLHLRAGEWVEVRGKEEILESLDKQGRLEGLPFMPEMFAFCGKRFRVFKRAHKTCDTVNDYMGRKMQDAVHLDGLRCDGHWHGGCQASCLLFWKAAWLKRVPGPGAPATAPAEAVASKVENWDQAAHCTEEDVMAATSIEPSLSDSGDPIYTCQATLLPSATEPLPWWNLPQYIEDYTSGNVGLGRLLRGFIYMGYNGLINAGLRLGGILRWLYDTSSALRGCPPYPRRTGQIPVGEKTPDARLNLQPGEQVRVKSYKEILATLDASNKNRGLCFDAEMVPYCGGTYRVLKRVTRIVNERSGKTQGKMQEFKNPCIILEAVVCQARYSECRLFCPRSIYPYWREIWLERVDRATAAAPKEDGEQPSS